MTDIDVDEVAEKEHERRSGNDLEDIRGAIEAWNPRRVG